MKFAFFGLIPLDKMLESHFSLPGSALLLIRWVRAKTVVGPSFSFSDCFEFNLNGSSHAWQ